MIGISRKFKKTILKIAKYIDKLASYAGKTNAAGKFFECVLICGAIGYSLLKKAGLTVAKFFAKHYRLAFQISGIAIIGAVIFASQTYAVALKVEIDNVAVGYVNNQQEYELAIERIENAISEKVGEEYFYEKIPTFSYSIVNKNEIGSEQEVYDVIYPQAEEEIGQSYGLFVDGEFIGACRKESELLNLLEEIKKEYSTGTPGETVEFIKDVTIEKNMYARSLIYSADEIKELFATPSDDSIYIVEKGDSPSRISTKFGITISKLKALNPDKNLNKLRVGQKLYVSNPKLDIGVKVVRTITYTETIAYTTKNSYTNDLYEGQTKTTTKGKNGQNKITATVTYIDGEETERVILEKVNLSKPVTAQVLVGTKPIAPSGTFVWPVPASRRITSPYGQRWGKLHAAIDIGAPKGSAIVAVDAGTVVTSGWLKTGAGYAVVIDHGNGIYSRYYHCSALYVKVGQKVIQGQTIAAVGATGNATGPHLHFELTNNSGSNVNPTKYLK